MLTFEMALALLKDGKCVQRTGWRSMLQYIKIQKPDSFSKMTQPYIYIVTHDGSLVPWVASQTDILSNDWVEKKE